jgi:uncharacterized protein YecE (DUF72 family)
VTEVRVGTGGWAYFHGQGEDPLSEYARAFDFVEVNSTFYDTPELRTVRTWRDRVPDGFEFSIRAHRGLMTEKDDRKLSLTLKQHAQICKILRARFLVLTPAPSEGLPKYLLQTLSFLQSNKIIPVIDSRHFSLAPKEIRELEAMQCVQAIDVSLQAPAVRSTILYSRLFGIPEGNQYRFSDDELRRIREKAISSNFEESLLAFHGVKMYSDAARFKSYHLSGIFPMATSKIGPGSLREVLEEDMRFPATKADLISFQGWKLIDSSANERVRVTTLLERLPERTYHDIEEVISALTWRT